MHRYFSCELFLSIRRQIQVTVCDSLVSCRSCSLWRCRAAGSCSRKVTSRFLQTFFTMATTRSGSASHPTPRAGSSPVQQTLKPVRLALLLGYGSFISPSLNNWSVNYCITRTRIHVLCKDRKQGSESKSVQCEPVLHSTM